MGEAIQSESRMQCVGRVGRRTRSNGNVLANHGPNRVLQEYEQLKVEARARGSGQREEMAEVERQLASVRSKLAQLGSEQVLVIIISHPSAVP